MAMKRTRMDELKDVIYYGKSKAKAMKEMEDATLEMSRYCAWLTHLNQAHGWITKNPNGKFFDIRELIKECPNKGVRDFFMEILDEWNQMRAEQLHVADKNYYNDRMYTLFGQAEAMVGGYYGVQTLLDILEWYITY